MSTRLALTMLCVGAFAVFAALFAAKGFRLWAAMLDELEGVVDAKRCDVGLLSAQAAYRLHVQHFPQSAMRAEHRRNGIVGACVLSLTTALLIYLIRQ